MNPQYKFTISINGVQYASRPIYSNDLAIDYALESGEQFYRGKISGELTFKGDDYDRIYSQPFDTEFFLEISISYDGGTTWASYWKGKFWKTDCRINEDDKTIIVTPELDDAYSAVLDGLDKEFNLIDLVPEILPVKADKRPMVQVYVPGQNVIGCFLSGMWWEQECDVVNEGDQVEIGGVSYPALTHKYYFALNKTFTYLEMTGETTPQLPSSISNTAIPGVIGASKYFDFIYGDYRYARVAQVGPNDVMAIYSVQTGQALWRANIAKNAYDVVLYPIAGQGATGDVHMVISNYAVYARYLCDTAAINGDTTYPLPDDDLVPENRNYTRAIGYNFPDTIWFGTAFSATSTQWGLYQPGQYYKAPTSLLYPEMFPVARNAWGRVSIWFAFSAIDWLVEESGREPFLIRYAYPLWSVISVLLGKIAPSVTHQNTADYSLFFYGVNPLFSGQTILITPKSNIVTAGYDQPAQKAPITLRDVLDMLRDCYRCYWFIDSSNRLRIEHILYFRNGGSYNDSPVVGTDLTTMRAMRNGKPWAFCQDTYKWEKPAMSSRYQFAWMDDVTQLFEGYPIEIISKYVQENNVEQVSISKFTSDVDYILLNPSAVSKDGFVLLAAKYQNLLSDDIVFQTDGETGYAKLFDYSDAYGPDATIRIATNLGYADIYYYDANGNNIGQGPRFAGAADNYTITMPDNGAYIGVVSQVPGATITLSAVIPEYPQLPYENFVENSSDHILQNAYASFAWLQQLYAYDMPAWNYEINGEAMVAQGIKKLKVQEVGFPALNNPDLIQLIKTNLGNGVIEKISITLPSRYAKATLRYDTEEQS